MSANVRTCGCVFAFSYGGVSLRSLEESSPPVATPIVATEPSFSKKVGKLCSSKDDTTMNTQVRSRGPLTQKFTCDGAARFVYCVCGGETNPTTTGRKECIQVSSITSWGMTRHEEETGCGDDDCGDDDEEVRV